MAIFKKFVIALILFQFHKKGFISHFNENYKFF